jgi:uncharacterized protein YdaU (DUF1376 family)
MTKPPAYQYYAADFDEDTASWDCYEVGVYQRLLNYEWINGCLPNEPIRLARIARTSSKKFQKSWEIISKKFSQNGEGFLVNRRMEEEREKQRKYREEQARKGKIGADKRWNGDSHGHNRGDSPTNGREMALQSSSSIKDKEKDIQLSVVLRDKSDFKLYEEKILEYQKAYPNIAVRQELLKIIQWNQDNPAKRKTRVGILRHINSWLSGAQGETKNIEAAPKPREWKDVKAEKLAEDGFTPEQLKSNKGKTNTIVEEWGKKHDINRMIGGKDEKRGAKVNEKN